MIADFGCGEAQIANTIPNKVHSFDLVAANDKVTACDMASVPLATKAVDVVFQHYLCIIEFDQATDNAFFQVVFCLSLMGSNIHDFLKEANRVLKIG